MTPTDIGAFCAHCQKEVVDFTQHTPTEIASFVSNTKGKICGRLSSAQLNEVYEYYIPVQKHNIKYAAGLALGLLATSKSIAQENKQAVEIITKIQDSKNNLQITNIKGANEKITVHGKVIDGKTGEPLIGVNVEEENTANGAVTDIDGNYSIKLMKFPSKLLFKYIGYADESINIGYKSKDSLMVKITPLEPISMGAVVVVKFNDDVYRGVKPIINHTKRKHPKNK
ncbi:MAG TPA: carboxypeptidase-like regulatory domain-containing protein [Chitinophagales bacterium]|nr:carboxypeptidase-like regulatory domain-containing protein [Chitinophagales bacterium]HNL83837.1 carboxypeptidase-like regulatory domain-containing protein [Chitinophagales bacterium]